MAEDMAEEFYGEIPGRGARTAREQPLSRVRITVTLFFSHEQWQPHKRLCAGCEKCRFYIYDHREKSIESHAHGYRKGDAVRGDASNSFWGCMCSRLTYVSSMLFFGSPPLHAGMSSRGMSSDE